MPMARKKSAPRDKPVVEVKPHTYQPSRAELREEVKIDTDPERLASYLMRSVTVKKSKS